MRTEDGAGEEGRWGGGWGGKEREDGEKEERKRMSVKGSESAIEKYKIKNVRAGGVRCSRHW